MTLVLRTLRELREQLAAHRGAGRSIALVPTMGALHEGHLSLVREAGDHADVVVVTVFVNPAQFDDAGDLAAYPRTEEQDVELATAAGADLVLVPAVEEIYPPGFATSVQVQGPLTRTLEGAHRGEGHFHGVTTVVARLLITVAPDVAVFGAKDAQQVRVVTQMVDDLGLPVRIVVGDTVREPDGLALSSRNVRLSPAAREQALGLSEALHAAQTLVDRAPQGPVPAAGILDAARRALAARDIDPEYVALVDPATFTPLDALPADRPAQLLLAAPVGGVRLIDNSLLRPTSP